MFPLVLSRSVDSMYYEDFVVQILCFNESFINSLIYNGFLYDLECKHIITSGHAAGYDNYIVLMKDGELRTVQDVKVGSLDAMILKLDAAYPKRKRALQPPLLQDIEIGDSLVIANYNGPVTVNVNQISFGCIFTTEKGYPGSPVFKDNRFVGMVKGNSNNILPASFIDEFLLGANTRNTPPFTAAE